MLGLRFEDFSLTLLVLCILYNNWSIYFLNLNYSLSKFCSKQVKFTSFLKKTQYKNLSHSFVFIFFIVLLFFFFYFFMLKGFQKTIFFNLIYLNNKSFYFTFFYIFFLYFFFMFKGVILKTFFFKNNSDFLISLILLLFFSISIFFSNTLFSFFFNIEVLAILMSYFISSSKEFFLFNKDTSVNLELKSKKKKEFFNTIFFNFWSSFFSSIFLLYSMLNIYFIFGTTEWSVLNFLLNISNENEYFYNKNNVFFIFFIFFLSCIFKLGLPPFFFFKIEMYKGLPLFITYFYSTFFFFSYFSSFFFIFFIFFTNFYIYFSFYFFVFAPTFILFFYFYLATYDNLNCFFSVSTTINSVYLFYLMLSFSF